MENIKRRFQERSLLRAVWIRNRHAVVRKSRVVSGVPRLSRPFSHFLRRPSPLLLRQDLLIIYNIHKHVLFLCFVFCFQHRGGIPVSEVYSVNSSYPGRNSNLWRIDYFFFKVFLFQVCFYKDLYNSVMYLLIQNLSRIIIKFEVDHVKSVYI